MADIDIYIKSMTLRDEMKKRVGDFVDFVKSKSTAKQLPEKPGRLGWRRV